MALALSQLLRRASETLRTFRRSASAKQADPIESRHDLSQRYMRELSELVSDRQITAAVAEQVIHDLFEPQQPGSAPRVRPAVWRAYLKDRTGHIGPYLVGSQSAPDQDA